jgi:hypothetical protein
VTRTEDIEIFEKRWRQAKASGCTAVLFEKDKWPLIDMLLEEAKRSQTLRLELIEAVAKLRGLDGSEKVGENTHGAGGNADRDQSHSSAARAA